MSMQIQFSCMSEFLHLSICSEAPEIWALSEVVKCSKKETRIQVFLDLYL